jgi:hypothetical protein
VRRRRASAGLGKTALMSNASRKRENEMKKLFLGGPTCRALGFGGCGPGRCGEATGWLSYTVELAIGPNAARYPARGQRRCATRAVPFGLGPPPLDRLSRQTNFFDMEAALRTWLKSAEDRVLKRRRLYASDAVSFRSIVCMHA